MRGCSGVLEKRKPEIGIRDRRRDTPPPSSAPQGELVQYLKHALDFYASPQSLEDRLMIRVGHICSVNL
jgi:hypothetical protein